MQQLPFLPLGRTRCSPVPQGSCSDRKAAREAREASEAREAADEGGGTAQTPNARTTAKLAKPAERISVYMFCRENPTWCAHTAALTTGALTTATLTAAAAAATALSTCLPSLPLIPYTPALPPLPSPPLPSPPLLSPPEQGRGGDSGGQQVPTRVQAHRT